MGFDKIIEELKKQGIKVIKVIKTKPDTFQTYRIIGPGYDSAKTWKAWHIRAAYQRGGIVLEEREGMKKFDKRVRPGTKVLLGGLLGWRTVKSVHSSRKWVEVEGFLGGYQPNHIIKFSNSI